MMYPLWSAEDSDALDKAIREGRKRERAERNPPRTPVSPISGKATKRAKDKRPKPLPRMRKQRDFWVVILGTPGAESKRRFRDPNKACKFLNKQRKNHG